MKGHIWFVIGGGWLGLLIGFMAGLSVSPVVNTLIGLVFAFAGGSIVVLTKGRNEYELSLIGKSLTAISIAMVIGVVVGITLRANDLLRIDRRLELHAPFRPEKPLEVNDIIKLSENGIDPTVIRELLKANSYSQRKSHTLTMDDVNKLLDSKKVHPNIVRAMFNPKVLADDSLFMLSKNDIIELRKSGIDSQIIIAMLGHIKLNEDPESQNKADHSQPVLYINPSEVDFDAIFEERAKRQRDSKE